jgi:sugar phosphate isomerase/epimerase
MKLSTTTLGCPTWDLDEAIERIASYGYHGIDFRGLGDTLDVTTVPEFTSGIDKTRALLERRGLEVSGFSSSAICYAESTERIEGSKAELERCCKAAKALGTKHVRVFGGVFPKEMAVEDAVARAAPYGRALADIAAEHGCTLVFETHDNWIDSAAAAMLLQAVDHPAFQALWDMNHPWRMRGETAEQTMARIGRWIQYTHIKDSVATSENAFRYVPIGEGDVPVREAIRLLAQSGYDGWLVFEHEKRWARDLPEPETAFPQYVQAITGMLAEEGIPLAPRGG